MSDTSDLSSSRPKWAILSSLALLGLITLLGMWLAFMVEVSSAIEVDDQTGVITIEGPESTFTGEVTGSYKGHQITVSGLPLPKEIKKDHVVRRTFCGFREDPDLDWSQASASLRAHIFDERMDELCAPFD